VAQFSRKYFFTGAVLAYAIISAYTFAGFPYDNLCRLDNPTRGVAGLYQDVVLGNGTTTDIDVTIDEEFKFCGQGWRYFQGWTFPPTDRSQPAGARWMSDSQEELTRVYGWTAVAFVVGYVTIFFGGSIAKYLKSWWRGVYVPTGMTYDKVHFRFSFSHRLTSPCRNMTLGQKQHIDFSANSGTLSLVCSVVW
jgi:hypothetical protein